MPRCFSRIIIVVVALTVAAPAFAQAVQIGGSISNGNGGPLAGNTVYHVVSQLNVPAGQTLKINSGAILKFNPGLRMFVFGTLDADNVTFTSVNDDLAGGDLPANGPTTGAPGDWERIILASNSDASSFNGCTIRFAGANGFGSLEACQSDFSFVSSTIADGGGPLLDLRQDSFPTISGSSFLGGTLPIIDVDILALAGFTNNSASGQSVASYITISEGTVSQNLTLGPDNYLGAALYIASTLRVDSPWTLTLLPGTILKYGNATTRIDGTLLSQGTQQDPVVFAPLSDDTFGGDTNQDGTATTPQPGALGVLDFDSSGSGSQLTHTHVRFGGGGGIAALELNTAVTLSDCSVTSSSGNGVDLGDGPLSVLTGCAITDCIGIAIVRCRIQALMAFANNTASGNGGGDFIRVRQPQVFQPLALTMGNIIGPTLVVYGSLGIDQGESLCLPPGMILKFQHQSGIDAMGDLIAHGTPTEPIVITTINDDRFGGDTANDGPTTGSPGDWSRVLLRDTSVSDLRHVIIRNGGGSQAAALRSAGQSALSHVTVESSSTGGIEIDDLAGDLRDCVVTSCATDGLALQGGAFDVLRCTISGNGGVGVSRGPMSSSRLIESIVWGNGVGETSGLPSGDIDHCLADAIFAGVNGNITGDPRFADLAAGDVSLQVDSPCIDAGIGPTGALLRDIHGDPRTIGGTVDMGADEYGFPCSNGTVETLATGYPFAPLLINGSAGAVISIGIGQSFTLDILAPPSATSPAFSIIWGELGVPSRDRAFLLPFGTMCFPPQHANPVDPSLFTVANAWDPLDPLAIVPGLPTPFGVVDPDGCPIPLTVAFQAAIQDATSPSGVSVTNAVVLNIR